MSRPPIGLPPGASPDDLPEGVTMQDFTDIYYAVEERLGAFACERAERIRRALGDDVITPGDAVSEAYHAVWIVAFAVARGRVNKSERGLLVKVIRRALIKLLRTELRHASPRALVVWRYTRGLEKLENEIANKKSSGNPMPIEEVERRRKGLEDELDEKLAVTPDREYPEDDGVSSSGQEQPFAEKAIGRITSDELIAKILSHPWMAEQAGKENRQRYAFLLILKYEGQQVPGLEWERKGWTLNTGRVLLSRVRTFLRAEFPELGDLAA